MVSILCVWIMPATVTSCVKLSNYDAKVELICFVLFMQTIMRIRAGHELAVRVFNFLGQIDPALCKEVVSGRGLGIGTMTVENCFSLYKHNGVLKDAFQVWPSSAGAAAVHVCSRP